MKPLRRVAALQRLAGRCRRAGDTTASKRSTRRALSIARRQQARSGSSGTKRVSPQITRAG